MRISRRIFTAGLGAMAMIPTRLRADLAIGGGTLTTVSDGKLVLPVGDIFTRMPADEVTPIVEEFGLVTEGNSERPCNVTLWRNGDRVVLFDVGGGPTFLPTVGELPSALDAAGVSPDEITDVVFTHGHPDHLWGLIDDFEDLLFPDAAYHMGRADYDYWTDPATVDTIGEAMASFAVGAARRLELVADRISLFDDGDDVLPGIEAVATFGHTPGHMAFAVHDGSDSALVVGDALINPDFAFVKPHWELGNDQDPAMAAETRVRLLDRIVADDLTISGFHLPEGGIGRVERRGEGYRFLPG